MSKEETPQEMFDRLKRERKERGSATQTQSKEIFWVLCIALAIVGLASVAFLSPEKQHQKEYPLFQSLLK